MKNKHSVTIYSTPTCRYCVMAKDYFKANGIAYKDIDVSRDRAAAEEMVMKSGQMGVPVVQIDDNIMVGFQPAVFASLLA